MPGSAIELDRLTKRYRLGGTTLADRTFGEMLYARIGGKRSQQEPTSDTDRWFTALDQISFQVERGECLGIIGPNGAGKSTLLKILSRITDPTSGTARIRGRVASLLEVGTGFHPELTGRENIFLNGAVLGMRRREIARSFDAIVEFSGIERFLDTPVKRYSSGMRVRLAFAVAAHLEPEILIVDEVLAVGDTAFQNKCLGRMKSLVGGEGRTVLFVSHQLGSVRTLCDRCVVLEHGQLTMLGSPEEAISRYLAGASQREAPVVALSDRRIGPRMTQARLLVNGKLQNDAHMGDKISLEIDFDAPDALPHPRLGLVVHAEDGTALLNGNNRYQWQGDPEHPLRRGTIRCDLGSPNFMPGRYSISLWFGDHHGDLHEARYALSFEVAARDLWGHGKMPPPRASHLWCPMQFEIIPAQDVASAPAMGA